MPKKQSFAMQKIDGGLVLCDGQQHSRDIWVSLLADRRMVTETLSELRHAKTNPQLGYWHAVVLPFIRDELCGLGHDTLDFGGNVAGFSVEVRTTSDTVDMLLKGLFSLQYGREMMSKAKYTDEEMSGLIDFTVRWAGEKLQVVVPPPIGTNCDNA